MYIHKSRTKVHRFLQGAQYMPKYTYAYTLMIVYFNVVRKAVGMASCYTKIHM